jgi:hypothetical protein
VATTAGPRASISRVTCSIAVGLRPCLVEALHRHLDAERHVGADHLDGGEAAFVLQVGDEPARADGGPGERGLALDLVDLRAQGGDFDGGDGEQRGQRHGQGRGQLGPDRKSHGFPLALARRRRDAGAALPS